MVLFIILFVYEYNRMAFCLSYTFSAKVDQVTQVLQKISDLGLMKTLYIFHYENTPIQIYWKFHHQKTENFQIKILIFFIFLLKT